MHRDSLGTAAAIKPGEVNWMTAGRGIVHSERTDSGAARDRQPDPRPADVGGAAAAKEEMEAGFAHHETRGIPDCEDDGKTVRVVVGSLYGAASPVPVVHETMFGDVYLKAGASCRSTPTTRSARSM